MSSSSRELTEEDRKAQVVCHELAALAQLTPVAQHNAAIALCKLHGVEIQDLATGIIYHADGTFGRDFN
jgi:hypothetical protein